VHSIYLANAAGLLNNVRTNTLSDDKFYYNDRQSYRFALPAVSGLSELSMNLDFVFDIKHPQDRRFYPTTPARVRVMALGGPFQPWLDYRQELAGHLHYGMRCCICLEVVGKCRGYRQIWDMNWCFKCYDHYMLGMPPVSEILWPVLIQNLEFRFWPNCSNLRS
jgi:hypothetical protein